MKPPAVQPQCGEDDLISGLPDELLHIILVGLRSTAAAARTSVLSRRWRRVWTYVPELDLGGSPATSAATSSALLDSIDAALYSYSAPTLRRLKINVSEIDRCNVPAHRVAPWLRFASNRLAGSLYIKLHWPKAMQRSKEEVAPPACERATEIDINFGMNFVLRPPPTGSFTVLTDLKISSLQIDGGELGRVVSSMQCPRLRKLCLFCIKLVATYDVSIRSESLECLEYSSLDRGKLDITAPMLLEICVTHVEEVYIVAPKLEKVEWKSIYNPGRHQFAMAPRHLRSLCIMYSTWLSMLISSARLVQRFNTASELKVSLGIRKGIAGYETFLKDMDKLPACESLIIHLFMNNHALAPMMLHLLRKCSCIKKLKLFFDWCIPSEMTTCTTSGCPCLLPESYRLDDITFDSLEEIGISFFTGSTEEEEFVKLLLSRCNMVALKRVELTVPFVPVPSAIMEVVQRIHSMCYPNREVQFNVLSMEVPKPLAF